MVGVKAVNELSDIKCGLESSLFVDILLKPIPHQICWMPLANEDIDMSNQISICFQFDK